jgi:hypothetical protein
MQFAPGDLVHTDSDDPLTIKVKILVRLAQVQDAYLPFIVGHKRAQAGPASARLDALETELRYIHEDVIQVRRRSSPFILILTLILVSSAMHKHAHSYDRMGCPQFYLLLNSHDGASFESVIPA